jgi:DNA-directed RNA polymerase specialized sigma24 family protein
MISADKMAEWILESSGETNLTHLGNDLLLSAQRMWPRVFAYAQRELPEHWQPAEKNSIVLELWEKVLRSVVGTMHRHRNQRIEDLDAYLMGIFQHRLHRVLIRERRGAKILTYVSPEELTHQETADLQRRAFPCERDLQIKEIIACMNIWTKEVWTARMYGYSWADIGQMVGLTEHQTKMRFHYALSRIRDRLNGGSNK